MTPGCPKMAPELTQVALESSQDSSKVNVMRAFSLHIAERKRFSISSTLPSAQVITKFSQHSQVVLLTHGCGTRRAQPLAEPSLSERSEDSAVNRALRARIRRKLEAVKQEATQLPRLNSSGRRESVLCTYGMQLDCARNPQYSLIAPPPAALPLCPYARIYAQMCTYMQSADLLSVC